MINKKNSNRGGALLSVVIVMAIAGVLGALAISIAYTNYTMKIVDKKSKDNFYSAEKVLEEICVGLEKVASDEYKIAYTEVMSQYSPDKESEEMENEFKNLFVVNMISKLQVSGDSTKYVVGDRTNNTGLYKYVKNTYEGVTYTIKSSDNKIDALEDGLALRNVNVTYQDGNYYNDITTDIKISIPEVHFSKVSAMPEIAEFIYIAEGGIALQGASVTYPTVGVNLIGKAYSGVDENGTSITGGSGAVFNADNAESVLVVSKGDILLEGNSLFQTNIKTALWTDSITTKSAVKNDSNQLLATSNTIKLSGRIYVNDDTTLNGYQDSLILSGQYYGFSNNDQDASGSSAIIVNGKDIQINMSNLDTLVLAGTSFVGTKNSSYTVGQQTHTTNQDILMGDSVAIKSNQLAYLVPTQCAGITSNPMTHAQYEALPEDWKTQALNTHLSMIRGTLASYGEVDIVPVFEQNRQDGGTVYLYLSFADSETAAKYFMDYYKVNKTSVDKYLNSYLEGFSFTSATQSSTRIVTQGNYLVPVTGNNEAQYVTSTGDAAFNVQELTNYESSFSALCKKLITNESALTSTERNGTVYENLVDESQIDTFFGYCATNKIANTNITYSTPTGMKKAVFDGEVKVYIVDNNEQNSTAYQVEGSSGVVIATGDVTVSGNWDGLIICGGKLTKIGTRGNLVHNPEAVGKAMQMGWAVNVTITDDEGNSLPAVENHKVINFFRSGSSYLTGTFGDKVALTDVRNIISYENYKSE